MTTFEKELKNWFDKNHFDCAIDFNDVFAYDYEKHIVYVGVIEFANAGYWFENFLYEYGMEYIGIPAPVLCLLHEIGHHMTIEYFSDQELTICSFIKMMMEAERESDIQHMFEYWEVADEFSANMWAVNFINNFIEDVEELCNIYINYWNEFATIYMNQEVA